MVYWINAHRTWIEVADDTLASLMPILRLTCS